MTLQLLYGNDVTKFSIGIVIQQVCFQIQGRTSNATSANSDSLGPAVFSFDNRYLRVGYFQSPGRAMQAYRKLGVEAEDVEENEQEEHNRDQDVWMDEPSLWYAQDIYTLIPENFNPCNLSSRKP
uniref:Uncharacterized protein n=1 Tax=Glossina austeni TaxID=7395 RepID=A0A1A9UKZ3_GLOAU